MHADAAYRRFAWCVMGFVATYAMASYAEFEMMTSRLLTERAGPVGDLARIGYLLPYAEARPRRVDLPRRHVEGATWDGRRVDLVTIGDSFSNGGAPGPNPYYQDFVASRSGADVLNLQPLPGCSDLETVAVLLRSGLLDRMGAPIVLVQSVERLAVLRYGRRQRLDLTPRPAALEGHLRRPRTEPRLPPVGFINTGNLKLPLFALLRSVSDHALLGDAFVLDLRCDRFSGPAARKLIVHREEIAHVALADEHSVALVNDELGSLSDLLAASGRKLVFLPVVDKYDLYAPDLVHPPDAPPRFFELLRPLPRTYELVDTKAILRDMVERGVRDVFYADDTHWSWRAADAVAARIGSIGPPTRLAAEAPRQLRDASRRRSSSRVEGASRHSVLAAPAPSAASSLRARRDSS